MDVTRWDRPSRIELKPPTPGINAPEDDLDQLLALIADLQAALESGSL